MPVRRFKEKEQYIFLIPADVKINELKIIKTVETQIAFIPASARNVLLQVFDAMKKPHYRRPPKIEEPAYML